MTVDDIRTGLFARQDTGYRDFHSRLVPELDKDTLIGVRTPVLRSYAKELSKTDMSGFLADLPHRYYEENCLHAFLIEQIRDFDACMAETERFLPYIDNWATCDLFAPKVFRK
ncbi:MAG: DNA alkylation repair protein, partial [Oscillospiraceae bacterium]|nr:DNA alkylation repair protein [Oscillospiraceae bacterium]